MVSRQRQKELNKLRNNANDLLRDQQAVLARANSVLRDAREQAGHLSREEWMPRARTAYATRVAPRVGAGRLVASSARDAVFGTVVPAFSSAVAAAVALSSAARGGLGGAGSSERVAALGKQADEVVKSAGRVAATKPKGGDKADRSGAAKKAAKGVAAAAAARKGAPALNKAAKGAALATAAKKAAPAVKKATKGTALAGAVKKATSNDKRGVGTGGVVGIVLGLLAVGGIGYAVWQTLRADDDLWVADDEPEVPTTDTTPPAPAA